VSLVDRPRHLRKISYYFEIFRVVAIVGARQVGKSTLARQFAATYEGPVSYFDFEDPAVLDRFDDIRREIGSLKGLVVLDEVQRRPELFPMLRVLADRPDRPAKFLVLGSAAPEFLRQASESLAGRIAYHDLHGLAFDEVGADAMHRLWVRGGLPDSFTPKDDAASYAWRKQYVRSFVERDLPMMGVSFPAATMSRFWTMLAHWHAQIWNSSEFARSFGVADTTVRRYLDALAGGLGVRLLQPWYENLAKRQVKAPKVYVADSGVLHALAGIENEAQLRNHPKCGASWEGFAVDQVVQRLGADRSEIYFWAAHTGAELDLLVVRGDRRLGFEVKFTTRPKKTASMRSALADLKLDRLDVVHAGDRTYSLGERVRAVALSRLLDDLEPLR
jgi:predicted AAA+ superfamily ATPase